MARRGSSKASEPHHSWLGSQPMGWPAALQSLLDFAQSRIKSSNSLVLASLKHWGGFKILIPAPAYRTLVNIDSCPDYLTLRMDAYTLKIICFAQIYYFLFYFLGSYIYTHPKLLCDAKNGAYSR